MRSMVLGEREFKHHVIERLRGLRELGQAGSLLISGNLVDDDVQKILVNSSRADWFGSAFLPIIEAASLDCERSAPGSGNVFIRLVLGLLASDIRKDVTFGLEDKHLEKILADIKMKSSGLCSKSEFEHFRTLTVKSKARIIVDQVLDIYKLGDQISVKKSYLRNTQITKTSGYVFDNITFNPLFTNQKSWIRNDVNVIIVDGIIESIGEIHHLLEISNRTCESYMIICSGVMPEPLDMIIQNFVRKTIDVVVGVVNPDEFGIHSLVDIGTICLTAPISAMKGETITQSMLRLPKKIDRVEITQNLTMLKNDVAKDATATLLKDVILRAEKDLDIAHLFHKRIKCLTSTKIVVAVGRDDVDYQRNVLEETDLFLRSCQMILSRGFTKKDSLKEFPNQIIDLLYGELDVQPSARIEKALECYNSIKVQINRTGTAIIEEKE